MHNAGRAVSTTVLLTKKGEAKEQPRIIDMEDRVARHANTVKNSYARSYANAWEGKMIGKSPADTFKNITERLNHMGGARERTAVAVDMERFGNSIHATTTALACKVLDEVAGTTWMEKDALCLVSAMPGRFGETYNLLAHHGR